MTTSIESRLIGMIYAKVTLPLPPCDAAQLKAKLYDEFRIEVPIVTWNNRQFIRVSIQAYNTLDDVRQLVDALEQLLDLET